MRLPTVRELFNLSGKVAIVTGGARHLGFQITQALAEMGSNVVITSRRLAVAREVAKQITLENKVKTLAVMLEVTDEKSWQALIKKTMDAFGQIDILVNNAGGRRVRTIKKISSSDESEEFLDKRLLKDWEETIAVNLTGGFLGCRAVAPIMKKQRSGKIINIASIDGIIGRDLRIYKNTSISPTVVDYLSSKGGIISLTRGVAVVLAPFGINVNCISPGGFYRGHPERFVRNYSNLVPLGRMARDGIDLKGAVVFCASKASDYMVGHNLVIDGGMTVW